MRDFANTWSYLFKHCISSNFLLRLALVQSAVLKELLFAPFVKHFKIATLGKFYWYIFPVFKTVYLNIVSLPISCWQ